MKVEAGHIFLSKLGKKRLRPGGKIATNWLIDGINFNENENENKNDNKNNNKNLKNKEVLEIACNMGTTLIELSKRFAWNFTGVDIDKVALEKAKINIKNNGLEDRVKVIFANATNLPFEDNSFDIVINEAMLTMLSSEQKTKALSEYYRVLKKGGQLLTHDLMITEPNKEIITSLRNTINVNAQPLLKEEWENLFKENHFKNVTSKTGKMTLMPVFGMIRDEGIINTFKIIKNGLKSQNKAMFKSMYKLFTKNKKLLHYIAIKSTK